MSTKSLLSLAAMAALVLTAAPVLAQYDDDSYGESESEAEESFASASSDSDTSAGSTGANGTGIRMGAKAMSFTLPSGGGASAGYTMYDTDKTAIQFGVGLVGTMDNQKDQDNTMGISLEGNYIMYKSIGTVSPFLKFGGVLSKPPGGDLGEASTLAGGAFMGVELFFMPQLSISGAIGAVLALLPGLDDDGDPALFKIIQLSAVKSTLSANIFF